MTMLLLGLLLLTGSQGGVVGGVVGGVPQGQPRDPRMQPRTGTAIISGRVTAADTGAPIRRAAVNLSGTVPPRTAYTDHEGRYHFANLPSGTFNLFVTPGNHRAGYQSLAYGASPSAVGIMTRPKPIELTDGQKLENIDVALPRTGVITGRVTDAQGEPASRLQVTAWILRPGAEPTQTGFAQTDDLGQYRLFGLAPGDYLVMANVSMGFGVSTQVEGEPIGFAPTYAPGTPVRSDAMRLRVTRGGQASADIVLTETRVYKISGTAVNSKGEPMQGSVMLTRTDNPSSGGFGAAVLPNGAFTINNVPPGQYEVVARWAPPRQPGVMMTGPDPNQEFASVQVDVGFSDVEGVLLATSPGATVTGEIVMDEPLPPGRPANIFAQPGERRQFMSPPRAEVKDTTFTLHNVFGPLILRGSIPAPGWALKAVLLRGKDITDLPTTFRSSDSGHLQIVFTGTAPAIEGTITDEAGRPTSEAAIVLFGQDPSTWIPRSSYLRTIRAIKDGKYMTMGLREGRYFAVAVPAELAASMSQPTTELFESLSKVATPVILNPGEKRTVDLTVVRMQQQ